ncbi:MAG: PAS domain-containing protein [Candidatus Omnitrophica bacterium]|nr:PAS domain-containing protein [Candidatus Omnitrophota bacterium]
MKQSPELLKRLAEMLSKWCLAENNRKMYGFAMPQAQKARDALFPEISNVLELINEFSFVKKEDDIQIMGPSLELDASSLKPKGLIKTIRDSFDKLSINSITIKKGLGEDELEALFSGLNMSLEELKSQNGMHGFLKNNKIKHIESDQLRFMLVKGDEDITIGKKQPKGKGPGEGPGKGPGDGSGLGPGEGPGGGSGSGPGKGAGEGPGKGPGKGGEGQGGLWDLDDAQVIEKKAESLLSKSFSPQAKEPKQAEPKMSKREFNNFWKEYFEGKSKKDEAAQEEFSQLIQMAKEKPKELANVLKRIVKKQKDIETYLDDLDKRLSELGFNSDTINDIKKTLTKPQKVTIAKDELERLKKLEKDFDLTLEQRVENSIKEIKKINRKLSDEKERMNTILRQSSQGIIVINKEGKILSLNNLAEKALGESLKESQNKSIKDLVGKGKVLSLTSEWEKENDEFTPKEVEIHSCDSQTRDIIGESSAIVEDENGKAIGMVSSLQNAVQEEELKKRRSEIMDVLGHDLRAPICAAKQNLSVLVDAPGFIDKLEDVHKNFLNTCKKSLDKMEKLVNTIMDVRQLETGKIILRKDLINISDLAKETVGMLKSWAEDKKIDLKLDVKETNNTVADPERITQVINNLISNALKFTPEQGSITLSVCPEKNSESGQDLIKVAVIDTGIGISKEDIKRVFKKYEQVSLKRPKGESGLGLGLSICQTIVEMHSGKIWAESEENKGSTFIFTLPVKAEGLENNV